MLSTYLFKRLKFLIDAHYTLYFCHKGIISPCDRNKRYNEFLLGHNDNRCMGIQQFFSTIFLKGQIFCDFLSAFMDDKAVPKNRSPLGGKNLLQDW